LPTNAESTVMPHPAHLTHVDRRQFFLTDCQWPSKWVFLPFIDNNAHSRKNSMMFYMPKYFCCLSTPFFRFATPTFWN